MRGISMKKLRNFIVASAFIGHIIMFVIIYLVISLSFEGLLVSQIKSTSKGFADTTFNSAFRLMRRGWTKSEIEEFLKANSEALNGTLYSIDVFNGGEIRQDQMEDKEVLEVLSKGKEKSLKVGNTVRYLYPLNVEWECLKCHTKAKVGDTLGVIDIKNDLSPAIWNARKRNFKFLLLISPIPIIGAFSVAGMLSRRINRSAGLLHRRVENVNRVRDLKAFEMEDVDLSFEEFNALFKELKRLIQKLRETAVDKDILELEVRLLERFIITSEVVKDWKDHVKHTLIEMNRIIDIHFLFSLFLVKDKNYDLEVFWRNTPSQRTKEIFEKVIKEKLSRSTSFRDINGLNIIHNVALPHSPLLDLKEEVMQSQTKALILETSRIGGIVGIGVSSELTVDPTKFLVIENILTTLLNVVGSVKAIYKYAKELEHLATRDPLTNLYNQRVFWDLLNYEIERTKRYNYKFSLLVMDLDNFKIINDTYGHAFGDRFLQEFAQVLRDSRRMGDILARYGGDEFVMILPGAGEEQAHTVSKRIMENLRDFSVRAPDGIKVKATASIGISVFPDHAQDAKRLFLLADNMMYRAKSLGKDGISISTYEEAVEVTRGMDKKNIIINALEEKRIIPYFQPIMNVKNKRIEAHEVLMRIELPGRILTAGEFIESAEGMGVVSKMDYILMEKVFKKVKEISYKGYLFLNLSPRALVLSEFMPSVHRLMRNYGIEPSKVVFEITERETVRNLSLLEKFILDLKLEGFRFAIDDFGAGFSSFQYVKRLPVDFIKIYGEFVRSMGRNGYMDKVIVASISTFAREIGIKTVAEFTEDGEIFRALESVGVDYAQGYYIGRPSPELLIVD